LLQITGCQPDIIHVHEWQTSAVAMLYWDMYHHLSLKVENSLLHFHSVTKISFSGFLVPMLNLQALN
jgi:glycogen synthase